MATDPQITRIVGELDRFTVRVIRAIVLEVRFELVHRTPVDTGWARANWVPSLGVPTTLDLSGFSPTQADASSAASAAESSATQIASTIQLGVPVFITNNVPYIGKLNSGSSAQAPAGFIEASIDAAVATVGRMPPVRGST